MTESERLIRELGGVFLGYRRRHKVYSLCGELVTISRGTHAPPWGPAALRALVRRAKRRQ